MSDAVWLAIIGVVAMAVKEYFDRGRAREAKEKTEVVESKVDANTAITTETKEVAESAASEAMKAASEVAKATNGHADTCDEERIRLLERSANHEARIAALEAQMAAMGTAVKDVSKNVDDTRHKLLSPLQAIVNEMKIASIMASRQAPEKKEKE